MNRAVVAAAPHVIDVLPPVAVWDDAPVRRFRLMRIIWPLLVHLDGLGTVWLLEDGRTGRCWACRREGS